MAMTKPLFATKKGRIPHSYIIFTIRFNEWIFRDYLFIIPINRHRLATCPYLDHILAKSCVNLYMRYLQNPHDYLSLYFSLYSFNSLPMSSYESIA